MNLVLPGAMIPAPVIMAIICLKGGFLGCQTFATPSPAFEGQTPTFETKWPKLAVSRPNFLKMSKKR